MPRPQKNRISGNDYPPNWKEIATAIKDAHGWICERCEHPHDPPNGYTLTVHHLDMDPANCEPWNLAALCQRCHLRIQNRVDFEQGYMLGHTAWMRPHVDGFLIDKYLRDFWGDTPQLAISLLDPRTSAAEFAEMIVDNATRDGYPLDPVAVAKRAAELLIRGEQ